MKKIVRRVRELESEISAELEIETSLGLVRKGEAEGTGIALPMGLN